MKNTMSSSNYKLIIFDWDGTLVDSIERIATSLQAASHQICRINIKLLVILIRLPTRTSQSIDSMTSVWRSLLVTPPSSNKMQNYVVFDELCDPRTAGAELEECQGVSNLGQDGRPAP